jgi:hypothetical protein
LPALTKLNDLVAAVEPLLSPAVSQTQIFFLSDGAPSDQTAQGTGSQATAALTPLVEERMRLLAEASRCPLSVCCVGMGSEDFAILRVMASAVPDGRGAFHPLAQMSEAAITTTVTTFSSSITTSRLASIKISDGFKRQRRQVNIRVGMSAESATYDIIHGANVFFPPEHGDFISQMEKVGTHAIEISRDPFATGGERDVYHMRFKLPTPDWTTHTDKWVVKENKEVRLACIGDLCSTRNRNMDSPWTHVRLARWRHRRRRRRAFTVPHSSRRRPQKRWQSGSMITYRRSCRNGASRAFRPLHVRDPYFARSLLARRPPSPLAQT